MQWTEQLGTLVGALLAPLAGGASLLRHGRVLHPSGVTYRAEMEPIEQEGSVGEVARRLSGAALVRLSSALWKHREWTDVLGVAIRLRATEDPALVTSPQAAPGDQDLLLATIRRPWTMLLAPWTTQQHDFLANDYYGVSPFEVDGYGRVEWRLVTSRPGRPETGLDRESRLERAVREGQAEMRLEMRPLGSEMEHRWLPVVRVRLVERVVLDQEALRFSPFLDGRGIRPYGFIHALRRATYAASQAGRQLAERAEERRRALHEVTQE
ncbi:MAG TPA: hypothetical protein VH877_05365 [Polyangia bacterium]|nr:hypothetical protein [Polyangia bacterium]